MSRSPDTLITLEEAAALVPGATADTLKRRARQGKLTVYRPGKAYLTTQADVMELIVACRVNQKVPGFGSDQPEQMQPANTLPFGLSETTLANAALDLVLEQALAKKKKPSAITSPKSTPE